MKKMVKRIINTLSQMLYILCIKKNHVNYGANCSFNGWGHIYNAGSILIGENVQINSGLKYNPIGGDTRNIIRVYKDASLIIGNHVGISNSDDMELKRHEILEKTSAVDTGDGVVVVTDMFGGTPSNLAISMMEERNIEVISGMNLPMLVKLVRARDEVLTDAVIQAQEAGQKYINIASHLLKLDS